MKQNKSFSRGQKKLALRIWSRERLCFSFIGLIWRKAAKERIQSFSIASRSSWSSFPNSAKLFPALSCCLRWRPLCCHSVVIVNGLITKKGKFFRGQKKWALTIWSKVKQRVKEPKNELWRYQTKSGGAKKMRFDDMKQRVKEPKKWFENMGKEESYLLAF